jgi:hypothetical protein
MQLLSHSERRTFWVPINGVKIPRDFEERGRITKPYSLKLAEWMAQWGVRLVNGGLRIEEAIPLGIRDIICELHTPEQDSRKKEYRGRLGGERRLANE